MRRASDPLFTAAFVSLTLSDLAYFMAGGMLIGATPLFVTRALRAGAAAGGPPIRAVRGKIGRAAGGGKG